MENIQDFINIVSEERNFYHLQPFDLCCKYKDICLKNYTYKPRKYTYDHIIHEWEHNFKDKTINVDMIRQVLVKDIWELFSELQNKYLQESQYFEPNEGKHENLQRKIKKIAEICIVIQKGLIFKEFIDCYRNGYFN